MNEVLSVKMYEVAKQGGSYVSGNMVEVIGEQRVRLDGVVYDQYLYNIIGYQAKNGKPFAALKENIFVF